MFGAGIKIILEEQLVDPPIQCDSITACKVTSRKSRFATALSNKKAECNYCDVK